MRTLNRPMFRIGGSAGEGITSGLAPRQGYDNGGVTRRKEMLMKGMGQQPDTSLSQFLIDFGLDIASRPPEGSILSTAAASAKDPYAGYKASKAARSGLEQKVGLTAAEAEMSHQDRMKELALKGKTSGALDVQKKARIIWNNNKGPTNPNGNVNPTTKEPWNSYEEVENWVVQNSIYSKSGQYHPDVEKDIAINEIYEFMVENDENVPDAYANAQQMKEIAEISYNVNNDPFYEDIKKQFDYNQIVIDPKNFGDKLPATETAGSTAYSFKPTGTGTEDPDYQHNKIYHNYEDGNFYIFNGTGNGSFILVTLTKE